MILKGNIRAGGQELARHLMNDRHEIDPEASFQPSKIGNERVELAELRGFASSDLAGAFAEIEGVAAGTNCTKPIYSLSINPSQPMTRDQYGHAIERLEKKLGLEDQARAVVFHVKDGREHCHVAWSRIDLEKMQARHMEFDRQKLREVARELVRDFGHDMPKFLGENRGEDRYKDSFKEVTLAERGQEERTGLSPAERRAEITEAYRQSDSATAFRTALQERGYVLAWGDKANKKGERTPVLVDCAGEVHGLRQQIEGARAKEIRETLRLDQIRDMPTVQQAKERIAERARVDAVEKAPERPQEGKEPRHSVRGAEEALKALMDAQRAEMKAVSGEHRETLAAIRESEREQINETKAAIKGAYRDDWRDLFKRQREEMQAATDLAKSPVRRLRWLLGHDDMDKQQDGAKGYLAAAFKFMTGDPKERIASLRRQHFTDETRTDRRAMFRFVAKGELDFKKMERTHERERNELADLQKAALREEIRVIRQDTTERRAEAREAHEGAIAATWDRHTDPIKEGFQRLNTARREERRSGDDQAQLDSLEQTFSPFARWGDLSAIPTADAQNQPPEREAEPSMGDPRAARDRQSANRTPEATREAGDDPKPARHDDKEQTAEAERMLDLARGNTDQTGAAREDRSSPSSSLDAFFSSRHSPEELQRAEEEGRKDTKKEREQDRKRGDDLGRTMGRS